jgi:hypothetical protein
MLRKTARQLQIEVNGLMAAIDKDEPTPFLIGRLTTIIARCQAGIVTSPFRMLEAQEGEGKPNGQTRSAKQAKKR